MAMHIAIALRIQLVLMNNIFNPNEFYLYNNGSIVEPTSGCDCYYGITCKRTRNCMQDISVEMILNEIKKLG
jgi:heptosyltransferase-2